MAACMCTSFWPTLSINSRQEAMAMNAVFLRLLPLLLMLLPPPLRDYLWAAEKLPSDQGANQQLQVYHPIIFVSGFSCPGLEARLTDAYKPSLPHCGALKGKGWFPLWYNNSDVVRSDYLPCFEEQMSLVFDPAIDDYQNRPGVETRVPGFGSARAFTNKNDDWQFSCTEKVRNELEALGYRDRDTLFGAPYDLRYSPQSLGQPSEVYSDYFVRVKDLVQYASKKNGNKPVIFIGHSFGARVILDFVNSTSLAWRKQFIKHMVLISPTVPTGFMQVVTNLASGPTVLGFPTVPQLDLRPMWWTFASSLQSLPSPRVFGHEPLVITKHRNYSAYDYPDFLAALGFNTNGILPFIEESVMNMRIDAPMVPTTYINGVGVQTPKQVVFWEGNFEVSPEVVYGNGDGYINWNSVLEFAKEIHRQHRLDNIPFKFVKILNATHSGIAIEEHSLKIVIAEILEAIS